MFTTLRKLKHLGAFEKELLVALLVPAILSIAVVGLAGYYSHAVVLGFALAFMVLILNYIAVGRLLPIESPSMVDVTLIGALLAAIFSALLGLAILHYFK